MLTLTVKQMRDVEAAADHAGLSYAQMMENAGAAAFRYLERRYGITKKRCLVLAGAGNNGGDGLVLARHIVRAGGTVTVVLCCGEPSTPLARKNLELLRAAGITPLGAGVLANLVGRSPFPFGIVVDAIFGTGFHGQVSAPLAKVLERLNELPVTRVSLDIPSGMNADTGITGGACVRADLTLSFAAYKPAHTDVVARALCGRVEVLDIGIPEKVLFEAICSVTEIDADLVQRLLPVRAPDSHKGNYGRLLNVAGSLRMGGAAMMCTLAAMRTGAGITTLATPARTAQRIAGHLMEAMTLPLPEREDGSLDLSAWEELSRALEGASACLIGCGLSVTPQIRTLVESAIRTAACPLVLDADALNCLSTDPSVLKQARRVPILTPHVGEMARLSGLTPSEVTGNAVSVAQLFAREYNAVVVLKGHRTLIAAPSGEIFRNTTGNAGLSKGGSGDVLAGMIAALLAQGLNARYAAVCGVFLHGLCADRLTQRMSEYSLLARDLIDEIPYAVKSIGR